jgi:serine/alanine adding enzyme
VTDVYFRRDYAEIAAVVEGGEAHVLEHAGVTFPVVVRETAAGVRDVTNPYGYGGALAPDAESARRFYDWYAGWCREHGVVTSFVRFHPLLRNHREAESAFRLEPVAGSVSWPLEGDLMAGMHAHHRRVVRKAERAGVEVSITAAPEDLGPFVRLYEETMRRNEASEFYFFPEAYWRGLEGRDWVVLLEAGGDAAIVCFATAPWLHYQFGASADAARSTGASHLLMLAAARWGQERGYEQLHLGAGVGGGGGPLLQWKQRFSPSELLEQWVGKAVHDEERYFELTGQRGPHEGFFPAFRG